MTKLLMTCGAAVLLAACASQPASTVSTTAPAASPAVSTTAAPATTTGAQPQQSKLICEDSTQIGSHFRSRVCLTPEQVEARHKAAQSMFDHGMTNPCGNSPCGGAGGPPRR